MASGSVDGVGNFDRDSSWQPPPPTQTTWQAFRKFFSSGVKSETDEAEGEGAGDPAEEHSTQQKRWKNNLTKVSVELTGMAGVLHVPVHKDDSSIKLAAKVKEELLLVMQQLSSSAQSVSPAMIHSSPRLQAECVKKEISTLASEISTTAKEVHNFRRPEGPVPQTWMGSIFCTWSGSSATARGVHNYSEGASPSLQLTWLKEAVMDMIRRGKEQSTGTSMPLQQEARDFECEQAATVATAEAVKLWQRIEDGQRDCQKLNDQLKKAEDMAQKERENYNAQLALRIRQDTSTFQNLNDNGRPEVVIRKYQDISNCERLDAADELEEGSDLTDWELLVLLSDVMQFAWEAAKKHFGSILEQAREVLAPNKPGFELGEGLREEIRHDLRRSNNESHISQIRKDVVEKYQPVNAGFAAEEGDVASFLTVCAEVAWMIVLTSPAMSLVTETDVEYNPRYHTLYSECRVHKGALVSSILWPGLKYDKNDLPEVKVAVITELRDEREETAIGENESQTKSEALETIHGEQGTPGETNADDQQRLGEVETEVVVTRATPSTAPTENEPAQPETPKPENKKIDRIQSTQPDTVKTSVGSALTAEPNDQPISATKDDTSNPVVPTAASELGKVDSAEDISLPHSDLENKVSNRPDPAQPVHAGSTVGNTGALPLKAESEDDLADTDSDASDDSKETSSPDDTTTDSPGAAQSDVVNRIGDFNTLDSDERRDTETYVADVPEIPEETAPAVRTKDLDGVDKEINGETHEVGAQREIAGAPELDQPTDPDVKAAGQGSSDNIETKKGGILGSSGKPESSSDDSTSSGHNLDTDEA